MSSDLTSKMNIRMMMVGDLPAVTEIDHASFSLPWPERSFRFEMTSNQASRCWVVEVEQPDGTQRVAAMMVLWLIMDEAHIGTIAVHPDFRQMGIGKRLLAYALLEAQTEGALYALLEVRRGNSAAVKMYEKFGFKISSVRPNYYKDNGEDALLMTLTPLRIDDLEAMLI